MPDETLRLLAERTSVQILRDRYFFWLLICTAVVAIGVLMEELSEIDLKKRGLFCVVPVFRLKIPTYRLHSWIKGLAKTGWLLVVAGIIGEGVFEGFVSREDGHLQSVNNSLSAITQKEASDARERAAQAELETAQLYAIAAPRRLSIDVQKAIGQAIQQFSGRSVFITSYAFDTEGEILLEQICSALAVGHVVCVKNIGGFSLMGKTDKGIRIQPEKGKEKTEALFVCALSAALHDLGKLELSSGPPPEPIPGSQIIMRALRVDTPTDASIFVGAKPPAVLPTPSDH